MIHKIEAHIEDGVWVISFPGLEGHHATQADSYDKVEPMARDYLACLLDVADADTIALNVRIGSVRHDGLSTRLVNLAAEVMEVARDLAARPGANIGYVNEVGVALDQDLMRLLGVHQETYAEDDCGCGGGLVHDAALAHYKAAVADGDNDPLSHYEAFLRDIEPMSVTMMLACTHWVHEGFAMYISDVAELRLMSPETDDVVDDETLVTAQKIVMSVIGNDAERMSDIVSGIAADDGLSVFHAVFDICVRAGRGDFSIAMRERAAE